MKLQQYYGNEKNFVGSKEHDEFYNEIKNYNNIVYDDLNIVIDYKIESICIKDLIIPFSNIQYILLENKKLLVNYYFGKDNKRVTINDSKYIGDIYENLNKIMEIKNKYLKEYLDNSKLWNDKYDSYVFMFICNYKELYLDIQGKKNEEIANNISIVINNEELSIKYNSKYYLITKEFKEELSNKDLDRFQFCYLLMHEYKPNNYLLTLRLCKEK